MGYDEARKAWVRFFAMSNGQYFPIRMTETGNGWAWKYVSFFKTQKPETPGSDAMLTRKSDTESSPRSFRRYPEVTPEAHCDPR
jgi:hypothetical protein